MRREKLLSWLLLSAFAYLVSACQTVPDTNDGQSPDSVFAEVKLAFES